MGRTLRSNSVINDIQEKDITREVYERRKFNNEEKSDGLDRTNKSTITIHIKELNIANNNYEKIEYDFQIPDLNRLNISNNNITRLNHLVKLTDLTILDVSNNNINGEGFDAIRYFNNLVTLKANGNEIDFIEESVFSNLNQLKFLGLSNNKIENLDFLNMISINVDTIILSHNQITSESLSQSKRSFGRLQNLRKLSLGNNQISEVKKNFFKFLSGQRLKELRLNGNGLRAIPKTINCLENIKILHLGSNQINDWKFMFRLCVLNKLTHLTLRNNPITTKSCESDKIITTLKRRNLWESRKEAIDNLDFNLADNNNNGTKEEEKDNKSKNENEEEKKENTILDYKSSMLTLMPQLIVLDDQRVKMKRNHRHKLKKKEEKKEWKKRKMENKLRRLENKGKNNDNNRKRKRRKHDNNNNNSTSDDTNSKKKQKT